MPHRDPETGKFVSSDDAHRFDDFEYVHATDEFSVPAADLSGATNQSFGQAGGFEAVELLDYDDIIDRHEVAELLYAHHRILAYITSTQTADGTVRGAVEISASPTIQAVSDVGAAAGDVADSPAGIGSLTIEHDGPNLTDTRDVLGPALVAVGYGPITDGTNGVGGAGTAGTDEWEGKPPGRWQFDTRDELFVNGIVEQSNVSDAAIHVDVMVNHVYGVGET